MHGLVAHFERCVHSGHGIFFQKFKVGKSNFWLYFFGILRLADTEETVWYKYLAWRGEVPFIKVRKQSAGSAIMLASDRPQGYFYLNKSFIAWMTPSLVQKL